LSDEEQNAYRREVIIDKCNRALDQLIDIASDRRRNYILDQVRKSRCISLNRKILNSLVYLDIFYY